MITAPKEYFDKLWQLQSKNKPNVAVLLPSSERIYEVNLHERKIEAPEFLSIQTDHYAETVYFMMDRYYDNVDLTETVGVIQYITPSGLKRIYPIPFYDILTYKDYINIEEGEERPKVIFPWCIDGAATESAGVIEYSIRFFKVDPVKKVLYYNMSTLPAKGKILHGMDVLEKNEDYNFRVHALEEIYQVERTYICNKQSYYEESIKNWISAYEIIAYIVRSSVSPH